MSDMQIECNGSECQYDYGHIDDVRNDLDYKINLLAEIILVTMFGRDKIYKPNNRDKRIRQREQLASLVKEFD